MFLCPGLYRSRGVEVDSMFSDVRDVCKGCLGSQSSSRHLSRPFFDAQRPKFVFRLRPGEGIPCSRTVWQGRRVLTLTSLRLHSVI